MIPSPNSASPKPFRVSISGKVAAEIAALGKQAMQDGWFGEFQTALLEIERRLRTDPLAFGEQISDLAALKLIVHVRLVPPLVVRFAIHQEKRFVVVMSLFRLPN